ncbi:MAG: hypothetical protein AB7C89_04400 [Intestinibacillus sp.]
MQLFKRVINYYRDPGNGRRLLNTLITIPLSLTLLWIRLAYARLSAFPPWPLVLISCGLVLSSPFVMTGSHHACWPICLAEILPILLIVAAIAAVGTLHPM